VDIGARRPPQLREPYGQLPIGEGFVPQGLRESPDFGSRELVLSGPDGVPCAGFDAREGDVGAGIDAQHDDPHALIDVLFDNLGLLTLRRHFPGLPGDHLFVVGAFRARWPARATLGRGERVSIDWRRGIRHDARLRFRWRKC
jgi:hypothetical protein